MRAPAGRAGSFPKLQEHEASGHIIAAEREQSACSGSWSGIILKGRLPVTRLQRHTSAQSFQLPQTVSPKDQALKRISLGGLLTTKPSSQGSTRTGPRSQKRFFTEFTSPHTPTPSAQFFTRLPSVSDSARHDSLIPAEEVRRHGRTRHGKIFS